MASLNQTLAMELLDLYLPEYIRTMTYVPWVFSLLGSALIGLSGILPLLIIPSQSETDKEIKNREYRVTYASSAIRDSLIAKPRFFYRSSCFAGAPARPIRWRAINDKLRG